MMTRKAWGAAILFSGVMTTVQAAPALPNCGLEKLFGQAARNAKAEQRNRELVASVLKDAPVSEDLKNHEGMMSYLQAQHPQLDSSTPVELRATIREGFESTLSPEQQKELGRLNTFVDHEIAANTPRWRNLAKQAGYTPRALMDAAKELKAELSPANLDASLGGFYGFHQDIDVAKGTAKPQYMMRPWNQVSAETITPDQVVGMSVDEYAAVLENAMEIEDPIHGYSQESGHALRTIFPTLGRFMGPTPEEVAYIQSTPGDTKAKMCVGPWCREENRHGSYYARLIERISGKTPDRTNPNQPGSVEPDMFGSNKHFMARQATEWGATAGYSILLAHSKGPLREAIKNVIRDEIKHLTIFSAAHKYLNGNQANKRAAELFKVLTSYGEGHSNNRTSGQKVFSNPVNMTEVAAYHFLIEKEIRNYMKNLPVKTLQKIFESPSKLPALPAKDTLSAERKKLYADTSKEWEQRRKTFANWDPKQREELLQSMAFEKQNQEAFNQVVKQIGGFESGMIPGSAGDAAVREKIAQAVRSGQLPAALKANPKLAQKILEESLRDYQITNNYWTRHTK